MTEENRAEQYTDIQLQFLNLLKKYPVKNPETVVDYVTSQDETVLEDPEKLAQALSECEISPVRRRQVLKHWFADKGVEVTPELLKKVTLPLERRKEVEEAEAAEREDKKAKYSVDEDTGAIKVATTGEKALTWPEAEKLSKQIKKEVTERAKGKEVKYVYDPDARTVRMAKEGEVGGTLEQAKELKKMAEETKGKEGGESPFIQDSDGNWTLNPKATVTGIELLAFESIRKAQERGEPVDPIEALSQAAEKVKVFREAVVGTGTQVPDWMTDPVKFIETVDKISGGGKGDEALKQQVTSLEKTLTDMRDDRYKEQIESQKQQIGVLSGNVKELADRVADLSKPAIGRTEMDIIHEIAHEGIGVFKTELPGLRRDIKEALGSTVLPPPKSAEERQAAKIKLGQAVQTDQEIEKIGRRLFFKEG